MLLVASQLHMLQQGAHVRRGHASKSAFADITRSRDSQTFCPNLHVFVRSLGLFVRKLAGGCLLFLLLVARSQPTHKNFHCKIMFV